MSALVQSHLGAITLGVTAIVLMAVAIVLIKPVLETQPLGWVTLLRIVGALADVTANNPPATALANTTSQGGSSSGATTEKGLRHQAQPFYSTAY